MLPNDFFTAQRQLSPVVFPKADGRETTKIRLSPETWNLANPRKVTRRSHLETTFDGTLALDDFALHRHCERSEAIQRWCPQRIASLRSQ
ncbi:hypothetical protein [Sphingobium boeckii]|uniref:Uncharacterized protein n=1 Tax=Sphingobium boeckii TaxID=1082345 RepID=A0A7W9EF73_9SPHN|nr:hypothetical protein [Sphingobium boeckii]MBB5685416.1 hypothetical protein [Sphingobium boeckii]